MNFKRKWRGYNRQEVDALISIRTDINNQDLEREDKKIELLRQETQYLEKKYNEIKEKLFEAKERNDLLEYYNASIDILLNIIEEEVKLQNGKILSSSHNIVQEIIQNRLALKEEDKEIEYLITTIRGIIEEKHAMSLALLKKYIQVISKIKEKYLPMEEIIDISQSAVSSDKALDFSGDRKTLQLIKNIDLNKNSIGDLRDIEKKDIEKRLRVMVIDDDLTILSMIKAIFEREGAEVFEASDGNIAVNLINTMEPPDIVILDIMLPYMDGMQILQKIRKLDSWKEVPVVMLTAKTSEEETVKALEAGANEYIKKPFNSRELLIRVKKILKQNSEAIL